MTDEALFSGPPLPHITSDPDMLRWNTFFKEFVEQRLKATYLFEIQGYPPGDLVALGINLAIEYPEWAYAWKLRRKASYPSELTTHKVFEQVVARRKAIVDALPIALDAAPEM